MKLTGRGQIKLTATFTENSDHGPLTIVGGTGEFAGASGDGNYRNIDTREDQRPPAPDDALT